MNLIIDDNYELKIMDRGLDQESLDIAETVEEGIRKLSENEYERLYLDYKLLGGTTGVDVLNWLSEHLDRVPQEIISVSFWDGNPIQAMADSLLKTRDRQRRGS